MNKPSQVWVVALLLVACDPEPPLPLDGGPADAGARFRDVGVPDCDEDPLLPGCVADTRPPFAGISAPVEIVRDADGVPHVRGANAIDTMYGDGYAQALDRLFEMDLARRRALGRRAEVLGAAFVEQDRLARVVDIPRWGRANEADLFRNAPETWALLQAWTEGVNARIDEVLSGAAPMPEEFETLGYEPERWSPSDATAFGKLVLFGNANQLEYTILGQILEDYVPGFADAVGLVVPFRDSFVLPPEERPSSPARARLAARTERPALSLPPDAAERVTRWHRAMADFRGGASNNWAVDGRHTTNGRPLVAGDPHQPLQSPSLFWMHHLDAADGSLDAIGWSFVGGPTVSLGHNRHVAWTATTTYPDMMDLWDVVATGASVSVGGELARIVRREERILVAGGDPIDLVCEDVPGFGVLLPDDIAPLPIGRPGRRLLFQWTGFRVTHELEGFLAFDRAESLADFEAAVDRLEIGAFNFVAADATGITYRASPLVPDRGVPTEARRPYLVLDGDDPESFWTRGFLDAALLPRSHGAARGWIGSANNDPYGFVSDGRIEGDPFYYGVFFDPGVRSARIESEVARLVARGDVTVDDMEALQDDSYTLYADDYIPVLEEVWAARATDPLLASFRDRPELDALVAGLSAWDRRMERASSDAVVFHAFMFFLAEVVLRDDLALVFDAILEAESAFILKWLSEVLLGRAADPELVLDEPRQVSVATALERTSTWLEARFPTGDYTWGELHGTIFQSLYGERLASPWIPTDGSCGTLNRADTVFFRAAGAPNERLEASDGSIYRMVASFRDDGTPEAFFTMGRGNSGDPENVHWSDLHSDWVETAHRRLRYLDSEVEADPVERLVLSP